MAELIRSSAPHIHSKNNSQRIMLDVIIALIPAVVASALIFGTKALLLEGVCIASAVAAEYVYDLIAKRENTISDLTAVVTGLLLGLNLSTRVELWQAALGSVFAIVVAKCIFGGLGKNFANPAITGRVFMLIVFASVAGGANPSSFELVSSATPLELAFDAGRPTLGTLLLGMHGGCVGETCVIALVLGYAYLVARDVIRWYVPATFIGTVFVLYLLFTGDVSLALYEILSGGLFLGAIFMATDYVTTPITNKGKLVFAAGCGIITFVIRCFLSYPEGVSFSILFMNLLVPVIEKFTKNKVLGGAK